MKKTFGYKYVTGTAIMSQLDSFAEKRDERLPFITKEFADDWGERRVSESDKYRYDRIRLLAEFSAFLNELGIISFIPRLPRHPQSKFVPYIYSAQELTALFKAFDDLTLQQKKVNTGIISFPALVRLLYSTGLRIGEAGALKNDDVNLIEGYLRVRDSKNGQERIIPISDVFNG